MFDGVNLSRRQVVLGASAASAAAHLETISLARASASAGRELSSFANATAWLNSRPLTAPDLDRKVILVGFWTYSCINWRRQLPYLRAWHEKYKDRGLVMIGVHTPEFSFEKTIDNVRWAAADMRIDYPIAVDSEYAIWRGFGNNYWPALYFIDARGRVRHNVFGEGQYEQSEALIQKLLAENGIGGIGTDLVSVDARGAEAAADWRDLKSSENYLGYRRTENFASAGARPEKSQVYSVPGQLSLNHWALSGDWTLGREAAILNRANGRVAYRFHARDLHLVMGPVADGAQIRFRVSLDKKAPHDAHGVDADGEGSGVVIEPRMYQLVRQSTPVVDRQFEIEFLDTGLRAFSFTFG